MTKRPPNVLELPLADRGLLALRAAVEKAIEEHAREGLPMYFWRDGKVVAVPAKDLLEENGNKKNSHKTDVVVHHPPRRRSRDKSR